MAERVLFVDLENVKTMDLSSVPDDVRIMVFRGEMQKTIPTELAERAQPRGKGIKWIPITGQGKNALDFHIAYYLGRVLATSEYTECVVLSRDKGFDPLVEHLRRQRHRCRRVESVEEAFPAGTPKTDADHYARLLELLANQKGRPIRRKALAGKIRSWFSKLADQERNELLERLFRESRVRESGTSLSYHL